jgi:hypothetical protein
MAWAFPVIGNLRVLWDGKRVREHTEMARRRTAWAFLRLMEYDDLWTLKVALDEGVDREEIVT